jgi:translocation and assembly module TamB
MKKVFKIFLYIILAILVLVLGVVVTINTPWGKEQIRKFAVSFLEKKLDTYVALGKIDFSIPSSVDLSNVLILDKRNDTLLRVDQLDINVDMLKLISGRISVSRLDLIGADVHMYRTATDTNYNYQFIIDSFVGKKDPSAQEVIDTAQASPIYLDAGIINIKDTRYRLSDTIGGTLFGIRVNNLVLKPRVIDLNTMRFEVADFKGDTIHSYFYALESKLPPQPEDTSETSNVVLIVDKLNLNTASFVMKSQPSAMDFRIDAKTIEAAMPWFSLQEQKINIDYFDLIQSNTSLALGTSRSKSEPVKDTATADSTGWVVNVDNLLLKEIGFDFDDNTKPKQASGIDYAHLAIRDFYLTGSDILYSIDTISGIVKNLSMKEKSGLNVQTLRTAFTYHSKGAVLDELYLKTPNTVLQDKMAVSYKSLESLDKEMGKLRLDIALRQSVLGFSDLFIFLPEAQKKQLREYRNERVNLTLLAAGPLEALNINRIFLKGLTRTAIDASGMLFGLPDADKLSYNLNIKDLQSSFKDIKSFVPPSVQQQVNIPAWFAARGTISGTTTAYKPNLTITTSDGDAYLNGVLNMSKPGRESYDLWVKTSRLNLGKILKMDSTLGTLTMDGKVKGVGFDPKTMDATLDANIAQVFLNGYNYTHLSANGYMKGKLGEIDLKSRDPNAFMTMKAYLDMSQEYPAITSNLKIEYINLKELKLTDQDIVFTGDVDMDVPRANIDYPIARIVVNDPFLTMNGTTYIIDSVYLYSNPVDSMQDITMSLGNIVNAKLQGHVPITKMGDVLLAHVNKFYRINDQKYEKPLGYDMNLTGSINHHRVIRQLVPDLKPFDTIRFYAIATPRDLDVGLTAPKIRYADMTLDTLSLSAVEQDSALMYVVGLNKFAKGNIQFFNSSLFGSVRNDSLNSFLNLADREGVDQFAIGMHAAIDSYDNVFVKLARGLKLNYDDWQVNPDNKFLYGRAGQGFYVDGLVMSNGSQSISMQSEANDFKSPFSLAIKNFSLANLTKMVSKDTLLADGILGLTANVDLSGAYPQVSADGTIDSLQVFGSSMGKLALAAENIDANSYKADLGLTGNGNDVSVDGFYHMKPVNGNELDLNVTVKSLALQSIEGLTFGAIRSSEGSLWGQLKATGRLDAPLVDGKLTTSNLKTTLSAFNTYMSMPNEEILFQQGVGMRFVNFEIFDRLGRKATLNGDLLTKTFTEYNLNMRFNADKWEAMNSTSKDNESIYGRIIVSAALGLKGPMTAPAIDGNLTVHDSTDFNYAMVDNPELVSNEGIVEFYDSKVIESMDEYEEKMERAKYLLSQSSALNVNVDIQKGAQFTVLIDPETGDRLNVRGTAFLNANLGADGNMALAGTYELEDGFYDLSIEFIKKKFKIQKGSIIQLAGDPLDAEANVTAIYEANIAPFDLLQNQLENREDAAQFKQRMPFKVLLKMSGKVMKPTISFDIVLNESEISTDKGTVQTTVETKLNELRNSPSDMNKQVVGVLAFGRFIAEDPFSGSGGLGIENAVRQSASRFLSEQLNRMAGNLIDGIELDMGINSSEDYSTGNKVNRTDLNITASKRLFNDRLKVSIGNDFALEGQTQSAVHNPSYLPGNISADYMITSDGRYIIRGYRKTELQNIANGFVIETGLSFRLALEYNRFKQLLMGRQRYRNYMRKQREEERKREELELRKSVGLLYDPKQIYRKFGIQ